MNFIFCSGASWPNLNNDRRFFIIRPTGNRSQRRSAAKLNGRGIIMPEYTKPSKETVRHWLHEQVKERKPPPSQKEIRRQLGWELMEMARNKTFSR